MNLRLAGLNLAEAKFRSAPKNIKSVTKGRVNYHKKSRLNGKTDGVHKGLSSSSSMRIMNESTRGQLRLPSVIKGYKVMIGVCLKI